MRKILVIRRTVPLDLTDEYAAAWQRLATACSLRAAHAWRFHRSGHDDRFVEFLEWQEPQALLDDAAVGEALRELEELAAGTQEELEEAEG